MSKKCWIEAPACQQTIPDHVIMFSLNTSHSPQQQVNIILILTFNLSVGSTCLCPPSFDTHRSRNIDRINPTSIPRNRHNEVDIPSQLNWRPVTSGREVLRNNKCQTISIYLSIECGSIFPLQGPVDKWSTLILFLLALCACLSDIYLQCFIKRCSLCWGAWVRFSKNKDSNFWSSLS